MKNTLRFSLLIIGAGLIGFGILTLVFQESFSSTQFAEDTSQSWAMIAFGGLCLISGLAYKKR